jgi:hypothetical protein
MTITDAVGQELNVGDEVAYVHKSGSSISIDRRIVAELGWRATPTYRVEAEEPFLKLDGKNARPVMPYNVVRIKTLKSGDRNVEGNDKEVARLARELVSIWERIGRLEHGHVLLRDEVNAASMKLSNAVNGD